MMRSVTITRPYGDSAPKMPKAKWWREGDSNPRALTTQLVRQPCFGIVTGKLEQEQDATSHDEFKLEVNFCPNLGRAFLAEKVITERFDLAGSLRVEALAADHRIFLYLLNACRTSSDATTAISAMPYTRLPTPSRKALTLKSRRSSPLLAASAPVPTTESRSFFTAESSISTHYNRGRT
jgi:hypothetical protein